MPSPLAYFLTWTCYGTWLHGDERSSVDKDHNRFGTPLVAPDESREWAARERQRFESVLLDDESRDLVNKVVRDHCVRRAWNLHALNVRTNHVHVVLSCSTHPPEEVMEQLKGWGTRVLRRIGRIESDNPAWTSHGSTRYLWDTDSIARAVHYVLHEQ